MITKIINANIVLPDSILQDATLIIKDGKIFDFAQGDISVDCDEIIDALSNYLSAGFIDLHTHGAGGADFMDCTVNACKIISETHAKFGTTLLYPTTLASTNDELFEFFDIYESVKNDVKGARFAGLHLEGPYFAYEFRGAQDPKYLRSPSKDEYLQILDKCADIKRWSLAPELDGAKEMARELVKREIVASIAHTSAIYEEVVEAHKNGYSLITHFYSCMNTVTRRNAFKYAGCIEAAYLIEDMNIEVIADGLHVPEPLLKLILRNKNADNIALVTDSMRAAGTSDKVSILGSLKNGQEVIVEDGVAKLKDRTAFAGSVATANRLVRTMRDLTGCELHKAVKMMTLSPARMMGVDSYKGKIAKGYDADLIIFDDNINVKTTIIAGKVIFQ